MLIKSTDTQTGQTHTLNWPLTFLWLLLDLDYDFQIRNWHFMHIMLHWLGWETKKRLTFNLSLFPIIRSINFNILVTKDAHLFWHCFLKFMVEQAFVHSALSHLSLQTQKNKTHVKHWQINSGESGDIRCFMFTHQHIGPRLLLLKAAVWSNPVVLTHSCQSNQPAPSSKVKVSLFVT